MGRRVGIVAAQLLYFLLFGSPCCNSIHMVLRSRSRQGRELAARNNAATVIQSMARRRFAWRMFAKMKAQWAEELVNNAAREVQRVYRGQVSSRDDVPRNTRINLHPPYALHRTPAKSLRSCVIAFKRRRNKRQQAPFKPCTAATKPGRRLPSVGRKRNTKPQLTSNE